MPGRTNSRGPPLLGLGDSPVSGTASPCWHCPRRCAAHPPPRTWSAKASGPVHPYREVDRGGHPVKVIPERLEAVDVRGEVLRPALGEDSPGCPQHPVGLEGLLQVLGQAAAVVDDSTELLHLWASGSAAGAGGPVWGWVDPPSRAKAARQARTPTGQPVCSSIMESTCTGELQGGEPSGSLLFLHIMIQGQYVFIARKQ